jgi:hypothetical protein
VGGASRGEYVQDKVRPGTGREGALGYERYIAIEHMDKVRPGTGREGSLGCVRRDCSRFAPLLEILAFKNSPRDAPPTNAYQASLSIGSRSHLLLFIIAARRASYRVSTHGFILKSETYPPLRRYSRSHPMKNRLPGSSAPAGSQSPAGSPFSAVVHHRRGRNRRLPANPDHHL